MIDIGEYAPEQCVVCSISNLRDVYWFRKTQTAAHTATEKSLQVLSVGG